MKNIIHGRLTDNEKAHFETLRGETSSAEYVRKAVLEKMARDHAARQQPPCAMG